VRIYDLSIIGRYRGYFWYSFRQPGIHGFIGYHGSAHSTGTLLHTYSGAVVDSVKIGGRKANEFIMNSYLAAQYDVPFSSYPGTAKLSAKLKNSTPVSAMW